MTDEPRDEGRFAFPYESTLHEVAPKLHEVQNAWLSAIESIEHLDRVTHELIRLACTAIVRNAEGCERHAKLAAEAGATWEQIVSALLLTEPAFGLPPAVTALPHARRGYERAENADLE